MLTANQTITQAELLAAYGATELPCRIEVTRHYTSEDGLFLRVDVVREFNIRAQMETPAFTGDLQEWAYAEVIAAIMEGA